MTMSTHLNILGTRGVPAAHGGFETFAERLALYLARMGHTVTVYCQSQPGQDQTPREDVWNGIHRVHIGTRRGGALGTLQFDLACVRHVLDRPGVDLVLGYNTAVFNLLQKRAGRRVYVNMDGIEWKRAKWSLPARAWLFLNEIIGANLADLAIADHPEIRAHVARRCRRRPVMIPYGADRVVRAGTEPIHRLGLVPRDYFVSIARIEPENSILELIEAHNRASTGRKLVVLGRLDADNAYHRRIMQTAGQDVRFPGAIYEQTTVRSLRCHARAYLHGHQVGGTNPSLVEALGAGNAVIAHDNRFNRWTAGDGQFYFASVPEAVMHMRRLSVDDLAIKRAEKAARARHEAAFQWDDVLSRYQALMLDRPELQVAAE